MTSIPNILYSNPIDFCDEAISWAEKHAHLFEKLSNICAKPESNIRHEISALGKSQALALIFTCLGYTKIETSALALPSMRNRLKTNIDECGKLLNIPTSAIRPIATIEQEILTLISEE